MTWYYPPLPKQEIAKRRVGRPPNPRKRLCRQNRALIRMELEHYHQTKEYLKLHEESVGALQAYDYTRDRVQSQPEYTPTEREAILKATPIIEESKERIKAIEYALEQLTDEQKVFVEERYWKQRLMFIGIALKLHVSESTLKNWDYKLMLMIGERLGWEV